MVDQRKVTMNWLRAKEKKDRENAKKNDKRQKEEEKAEKKKWKDDVTDKKNKEKVRFSYSGFAGGKKE